MKIRDYKNLNLFLEILFEFFKENKITSSLEPVEDCDLLLERILDSEYTGKSYYPGMYYVNFKLPERIEEGKVSMFNFGRQNTHGCSLLIDLGENDLMSFFYFGCDFEKHPPYLKDFTDGNGRIKVSPELEGCEVDYIHEKDVMSFDEFITYLDNNRMQKLLNIVSVD